MSIEDDLKNEIIKSINLTGAANPASASISIVLANQHNRENILTVSSGLPKIKTHLLSKFDLIVSQPSSLLAMNAFELRCSLCHKVIAYPAWYYKLVFSVNQIHYFVCFDASSPDKPTTRCYRRG